ncbi:GntR family transcriptional regulator [Saccharopolyspora endophytica]|uniref:Winged helix-turn-helix transcriptional regulator n=1 Tax=Saccharopolyspora endophytica TaxID=543886 RepID=A0ABS5DEA1_9PSEU|nr:winged helix-turn-helix domain-containing protein [Saccharopolyspora endophytica]MBQ0924621.1 winged helix-turn-helix transcriptional regulator [Saccharopolyspora endophytica]
MSEGFTPDPASGYIYMQLADYLEGQVKNGALEPGTRLPAERDLAAEYGVSLGTARRATEVLRERGIVVTFASTGTFIAREQKK